MRVEVCLRLPILVKDEESRIVGRDVQIVIDAALLTAGRRADGKQRLATLTLLIATVLYVLVAWVALVSVPTDELAQSKAPLALVFERLTGASPHTMSAIAVVATMYGAILANAIAGPMGDKLGMKSAEEIQGKEMMLQGILSIQNGDNPRTTMDKMMAFLPQATRANLKLAA